METDTQAPNDGTPIPESQSAATPQPTTTKPIIGFDLGASEDLAELEDQGLPVEWEDALGRLCYQPDGVTPLTVTVVGSLSKRYQKVQAKSRGRGWRRGTTIVAGQPQEGDDDETVGARLAREETEGVAACVTGWSSGFSDRGRAFAFSEKNAVRLLALNPHMQSKLARKMAAHADFFALSSDTSRR